jgi:pimeloyl-ACP methyl ester carboxylesterase
MVKPKNGEQMARWFPDAEFVWLENSSHFPQVDSPDVLVEAVSRWCL